MTDPRFQALVGGKDGEQLGSELRSAIAELERRFPGLGVTLFVFDFGPGKGLGYISNAQRAEMVNVVREWVRKHDRAN